MDYSAYYPSILMHYFPAFSMALLGIGFLIYLMILEFKRCFINKDTLDFIGGIVFALAAVALIYYSRAYLMDLPNIINKNYTVASGTAAGCDSSGTLPETRGFYFTPDDGDILMLTVTYGPVFQGDRFLVIYLPNTGAGAIIKKY